MRRGGAQFAEDSHRLRRLLEVVVGDANIQRLPASNCLIERGHRLFDRSLRIGPVGVEDVNLVESHALEALVQAGKELLSRSPVAVRSRPHLPAGLGISDADQPSIEGRVNTTDVLPRNYPAKEFPNDTSTPAGAESRATGEAS
jgi:hypothetical protein